MSAAVERSVLERARAFVRWMPQKIGYHYAWRVGSWLRKQWILLRHPHAEQA